MQWLNNLESLSLSSYNTFLLYWVGLSLISSLLLHFSKELPISNRIENKKMRLLGSIDKKTGWVIMEIPILLVVCYFFFQGQNELNVSVIMVGVFCVHYFNRAIIFPQRIKVKGKTMPVASMISSMIFYIINGYLIGHYFGHLKEYPIEWLYDLRFIIGLTLFILGFVINIQSDNILINLRGPGETDYKIPHGGFFKYVSCPNYTGECIEWVGFAIMTWSIPGLVYATWVVLPLLIQSRGSHQWYIDTFKNEYPKERKAIIPFVL